MKDKLTGDEQRVLGAFGKGEYRSLGKKATRRFVTMARRQIKEMRVNIRLGSETLEKIRQDAEKWGLPYQTLISSVLYRYAHGRLKDEAAIRDALAFLR